MSIESYRRVLKRRGKNGHVLFGHNFIYKVRSKHPNMSREERKRGRGEEVEEEINGRIFI